MNFGGSIFYDLPFHLAAFISKELKSPEDVLNDLGSNIGNDFSIQLDKPELLELSLKEFLQKDITKNAEIIEKIKDTWLESAVEIRNLFFLKGALTALSKADCVNFFY